MKKQDPLAIFPYGDRGAHICIRANFYRHKAQQSSTEQEAYAIGVDAYLYFYSLITMDITRKELSNVDPGKGLGGSMNSFANILAYPSADIKVVVRPISTRSTPLDGPVIVSVPDTGGSYYLLPMLDMRTGCIASSSEPATCAGPMELGTLSSQTGENQYERDNCNAY